MTFRIEIMVQLELVKQMLSSSVTNNTVSQEKISKHKIRNNTTNQEVW